MTITLNAEAEALVRKRLQSGAFENADEVLFQALESQDAEAEWQSLHAQEISDKIDRAIAGIDAGDAMSVEESLAWLEQQKAEWRKHRRS